MSCVPGVTVCVLALATLQPGTVGNTLLLTRLEKDKPPVTVQIPTSQSKVGFLASGSRVGLGQASGLPVPGGWRWWSHGQAELIQPHLPKLSVSSALKEFDAIQKEQKEISSCTDKREWWTGRLELDRRMEVCVPRVGWGWACPRISPLSGVRPRSVLNYLKSFLEVLLFFSRVRLFATPWTVACQALLSSTISCTLFKFMFIESVMLSNHLILCHPILLLFFSLSQHQGLFQ